MAAPISFWRRKGDIVSMFLHGRMVSAPTKNARFVTKITTNSFVKGENAAVTPSIFVGADIIRPHA